MTSIRSFYDQFDPEFNNPNMIIAKYNYPENYKKMLLDLIQMPPNLNDIYWISPHKLSSGVTLLMKMIILLKKYPILEPIIIDYIKKYPDEINKQCHTGSTALMVAITNYNYVTDIKSVRLLIENGANCNITNELGKTALILLFEIYENNIENEIIELFIKTISDANNIKNSVDLNITFYGDTALKLCLKNYKGKNINDIIDLLTKSKNLNIKNICAAISFVISKIENNDNMKEILKIILHNCNRLELDFDEIILYSCDYHVDIQEEILEIFQSYNYRIKFINICCNIF